MIATAPQWRRNTEPTKYASPGRAWVYESGGRTAEVCEADAGFVVHVHGRNVSLTVLGIATKKRAKAVALELLDFALKAALAAAPRKG